MSDAFQVLEDCPDCKVEGAVVALVDPLEAKGVAVVASCRMCGRKELGGRLKRAGRPFSSREQVLRALARWGAAEGTPDLLAFCEANMTGLSPDAVVDRVLRGEVVHTSFDVVAFLFPGMMGAGADVGEGFDPYEAARSMDALPGGWPTRQGGVSGLGGPSRTVSALPGGWPEPAAPDAIPDGWPTVPKRAKPAPPDPARTPVRALAAVILADGVVRKGERQFLERFCQAAGHAAPTDANLRPWRPSELARPGDPEAVLDAMVALAHLDSERDGSEWRVVREFARSWAFPLDELERRGKRARRRTASAMQGLFGALERLFVRPKRGTPLP